MAQLSLGESRWRMLRRVLKKKRFRYADARNMTRHDQQHFDWLLDNEFFAVAGAGAFEVTDKGKSAADLGVFDWEPAAMPPARSRTGE
ncbi:hypothetical protein [Urbifossiella limnaea]|nr:hypothetical protein [Urbifossiella limnaea]